MFYCYFTIDVESVDFARSQEAADIINAWCATATKNYIKNIVSAGLYAKTCISWDYPLTLLLFLIVTFVSFTDDVAHAVIMLINSIYFNGYWVEKFDKNQTVTDNFKLNSKEFRPTQFMTKNSNFYYGESEELDAKILRLPYKVNAILCMF